MPESSCEISLYLSINSTFYTIRPNCKISRQRNGIVISYKLVGLVLEYKLAGIMLAGLVLKVLLELI